MDETCERGSTDWPTTLASAPLTRTLPTTSALVDPQRAERRRRRPGRACAALRTFNVNGAKSGSRRFAVDLPSICRRFEIEKAAISRVLRQSVRLAPARAARGFRREKWWIRVKIHAFLMKIHAFFTIFDDFFVIFHDRATRMRVRGCSVLVQMIVIFCVLFAHVANRKICGPIDSKPMKNREQFHNCEQIASTKICAPHGLK